MNKAEIKALLEEVEHEIQYNKEHTKRQYRAFIGDYIEFVGNRDWKERAVVYNYMDKLKHNGASQTHIDWVIRGPVGVLFRCNGLRIPVKLPKVQNIGIDLTHRKKYSLDEMAQIIKTVIASGNVQWKAYVALSTIYGLRVGEMVQLKKVDIKPIKKTIMIYTLKGGIPMEHQIPKEILPYLTGYDFPPISDNALHNLFDEIIIASGIGKESGKSWHAIRHGVATQLGLSGIKQEVWQDFMRWKIGGQPGIYFTPENKEMDDKVLPFHPLLQYWK